MLLLISCISHIIFINLACNSLYFYQYRAQHTDFITHSIYYIYWFFKRYWHLETIVYIYISDLITRVAHIIFIYFACCAQRAHRAPLLIIMYSTWHTTFIHLMGASRGSALVFCLHKEFQTAQIAVQPMQDERRLRQAPFCEFYYIDTKITKHETYIFACEFNKYVFEHSFIISILKLLNRKLTHFPVSLINMGFSTFWLSSSKLIHIS